MKPKLFFPAMYFNNLTNVARRAIIVATTMIRILPNQTVTSKHKAFQPFYIGVKEEISDKLRYNFMLTQEIICDFLIKYFYNMSAPSAYKVNYLYLHNLKYEQICRKNIRAHRRFYALNNTLIFLFFLALINTLIFFLALIFKEKFRPAKLSSHDVLCDGNHILTLYSYNIVLNIFYGSKFYYEYNGLRIGVKLNCVQSQLGLSTTITLLILISDVKFQIYFYMMDSNDETNPIPTPMDIEGEEVDPMVMAIDLHLIESEKLVKETCQERKNARQANVLGRDGGNPSRGIAADEAWAKDIQPEDNLYFKNFNPPKQHINTESICKGNMPGYTGVCQDNNVGNVLSLAIGVAPYQRVSEFLIKNVVLYKKRAWTKPPARATPIAPSSAPKLCLVKTEDEGIMTVKEIVKKPNESAPSFYGDHRAGYALRVADFNCTDSYTCTFDIMRRCTVCPVEHDAFPKEEVGTLLVGDVYMPVMVMGGGKCVPTFRLHNATFREIAHKLRFLLKSRKKNNEQYIGSPRLIIISLPAYLKTVGAAVYLQEFKLFKAWATLFLSTREDIHPADHRIHKPCSSAIRVFEGFSLFQENDNGLAESFTVIARSNEILAAVDPTQSPGFFYKAMSNTMSKFCINPPPSDGTNWLCSHQPGHQRL